MDGRRARAVLRVREHATPEEIRRAFRARALATHPDRGGDRTEFELAVLAFETLRRVDVRTGEERDVLRSASTHRGRERLTVYRPFCAYDSPAAPPRRPEPRRFDDVLRAAMARAAHTAA